MNKEDIIRMARESGLLPNYEVYEDDLERFAALVAAAERGACLQQIGIIVEAEREACAKLVEDKFDFCGDELTAAAAIRARSSQ